MADSKMRIAQVLAGSPAAFDSQGLQHPAIDPVMILASLAGPSLARGLVSTMKGMAESAPEMVSNEAGAIFPKGYAAEQYPTSIPVKAYTEPGAPFYDEVKGLNPGHALYRAQQNWPGVQVERTGISPQNLDKAQGIMDAIQKLLGDVRNLKKGT